METISVIVPVYNVAPYLLQCLQSLAVQEYAQMEFILVDDGSTDESGAICDAFSLQDARFRVIHKQNGGVSSARNCGLEAARGNWIGFVDGDDWLDPHMYQTLARALDSEKADVAMCGYYEYLPDPKREPLRQAITAAEAFSVHDALYWCMTRRGYFVSLWNKLFRRDCIFKNGTYVAFDTTLAVGEDETWLMRTLTRCQRFAFIPQQLYHWRSRGDSATRMTTITPGRLSILRAKRLAVEIVTPYGDDLVKLAMSRLFNDSYHLLVMAYCEHNTTVYRQVRAALTPVRSVWLRNDDSPPLRKAKVITLELLMALHASSNLINWVYNTRRRQVHSC